MATDAQSRVLAKTRAQLHADFFSSAAKRAYYALGGSAISRGIALRSCGGGGMVWEEGEVCVVVGVMIGCCCVSSCNRGGVSGVFDSYGDEEVPAKVFKNPPFRIGFLAPCA